jgi:hypothetical protein
MAKRATRTDAWVYLSTAKDAGDIGGYRELGGGKWLVQVPATRYAAFHGAKWGEIVLSTREVLAFAEGRWAGRRINPTNRAGGGSAYDDFHAEERARNAD